MPILVPEMGKVTDSQPKPRFSLPGGMELTKQYYDAMDPFVTLSTARPSRRASSSPLVSVW
jgi:hypothetical protein